MKHFPRVLARRPRPASVFAAGLTMAILGTLGALTASDATMDDFQPDRQATVTTDVLGDDNRDGIVDEDESGWDCRTMGNRQCGTASLCRGEVEFADVCATVAGRPAYAWTDDNGTPHSVPSGRELLAQIDAEPGTEEFAAALFALDTQWVQHNEN